MITTAPQNLDNNLCNIIMKFDEPMPELASILLRHLKFMQDEDIKNKDDSNYKKEYLIEVRKFIVTLAAVIMGKHSYLIKQKGKDDFCINLLGTQVIRQFSRDSNFLDSLEIQKYLESAVRYLSNKWFKMDLDEFISTFKLSRKTPEKPKNNVITSFINEIGKVPEIAKIKSIKEYQGFSEDKLYGVLEKLLENGKQANVTLSVEEMEHILDALYFFRENKTRISEFGNRNFSIGK